MKFHIQSRAVLSTHGLVHLFQYFFHPSQFFRLCAFHSRRKGCLLKSAAHLKYFRMIDMLQHHGQGHELCHILSGIAADIVSASLNALDQPHHLENMKCFSR